MKNLQIIQKTTKAFRILSLITMICSFAGALFALTATSIWAAYGTQDALAGSSVVSTIMNAMDKGGYEATLAVLMYDFVWCLIEGILLIFAFQYLTAELKDGTPFTEGGAKMVKSLGIKMIVLPCVGIIISSVISEIFHSDMSRYLSNGASVAFGICLILFSFVLRYGAELERAKQ